MALTRIGGVALDLGEVVCVVDLAESPGAYNTSVYPEPVDEVMVRFRDGYVIRLTRSDAVAFREYITGMSDKLSAPSGSDHADDAG